MFRDESVLSPRGTTLLDALRDFPAVSRRIDEIDRAQSPRSIDWTSERDSAPAKFSGNVQLIVTQDSLGEELPRIETPNASIFPQDYGSYRITTDEEEVQACREIDQFPANSLTLSLLPQSLINLIEQKH